MVDPNRKINRLTEKDIEFLDECEEEFKDRFSLEDEEFVKYYEKEIPSPPIVDQWSAKPNFQDSGRGGRGGYRDNNRGRKFYNQRGNFRGNPYHRRGGHSSGYGGRDYQ